MSARGNFRGDAASPPLPRSPRGCLRGADQAPDHRAAARHHAPDHDRRRQGLALGRADGRHTRRRRAGGRRRQRDQHGGRPRHRQGDAPDPQPSAGDRCGLAPQRPRLRGHPRGGGLRRALGLGQPALRGAGRHRDPLLRLRLHALAQADEQPEHRDRWCRRRSAGAGRLGGGHRQPCVDAARTVRPHLPLDATALLVPGGQVPRRLPRGARADAPGGRHLPAHLRTRSSSTAWHWWWSRSCSRPSPRSAALYIAAAVVLGAGFLILAARLAVRETPKAAMRLFSYSITYLTVLFVCMAVDVLVRH